MLKGMVRGLKQWLSGKESPHSHRLSVSDRTALRNVKLQTCQAVIEVFEKLPSGPNRHEAADICSHYHAVADRLSEPHPMLRDHNGGNEEVKRDLHWIAIQAERDEVQSLYEQGEITRDIATELRRIIRNREASILEQE